MRALMLREHSRSVFANAVNLDAVRGSQGVNWPGLRNLYVRRSQPLLSRKVLPERRNVTLLVTMIAPCQDNDGLES